MSIEDDLVAELHALSRDLRSQKVVPCRRLRAVQQLLEMLGSGDCVARLLASVEAVILRHARFLESLLLDRVERICQRAAGDGVEDLVRRVGADRDFRRLNQRLRWDRAVLLNEEIPQVYVREHLRRGRRVRGTWRLVGFEHLLQLDITGRSEAAVAVIRRLAARGNHAVEADGLGQQR